MRNDSVGLAKQTGSGAGGLGTKQTTMEYFMPVESGERGVNTEEMTAEETIGSPFATDRANGVQYFAPALTGKCRGASLPRLLSTFLGDPLTTTPDAGGAPTARNHNFDPAVRPTPRALSVLMTSKDIDDADLVTLFWDAIGNELSIDVEMNDWIRFEAELVAKELDDAQASPTVTSDASRRFPFYECTAYLTHPDLNGGVEAAIPSAAFGFTWSANVPTDIGILGSRRLYRVRAGNRDLEARFTPRADLDGWWKRAVALDPVSFKLRLEALGPIIGAAIRHKIEIILPRLQAIEAPLDIDAGESVDGVEIVCHGAFDPATSKTVTMNVVNTVAAY